MKNCIGVLGRVFGHKFCARYSTAEKDPQWLMELAQRGGKLNTWGWMDNPFVEKLTSRTYVGEVCVRCGTWLTAHDSVADEISR